MNFRLFRTRHALSAKQKQFLANSAIVTVFACCMASPALAASNPIENMLKGIIDFINSGVIRSIGIIAIFSLGMMAYLGRISWESAMKVGAGLICTFGAAGLVDQFSGYVK